VLYLPVYGMESLSSCYLLCLPACLQCVVLCSTLNFLGSPAPYSFSTTAKSHTCVFIENKPGGGT